MLIASTQNARYRILGNVILSLSLCSDIITHSISTHIIVIEICIEILLKEVTVPGNQLFKRVQPVNLFPAFALEGIPNRNALVYAEEYSIQNAETIFRGTLRYKVRTHTHTH
jgi:hypothetical protein